MALSYALSPHLRIDGEPEESSTEGGADSRNREHPRTETLRRTCGDAPHETFVKRAFARFGGNPSEERDRLPRLVGGGQFGRRVSAMAENAKRAAAAATSHATKVVMSSTQPSRADAASAAG